MDRIVLDAMEYFKLIKAEPRRFTTVVKLLQETITMQHRLKAFEFINILLALDDNGGVKEDFLALNLLKIVHVCS